MAEKEGDKGKDLNIAEISYGNPLPISTDRGEVPLRVTGGYSSYEGYYTEFTTPSGRKLTLRLDPTPENYERLNSLLEAADSGRVYYDSSTGEIVVKTRSGEESVGANPGDGEGKAPTDQGTAARVIVVQGGGGGADVVPALATLGENQRKMLTTLQTEHGQIMSLTQEGFQTTWERQRILSENQKKILAGIAALEAAVTAGLYAVQQEINTLVMLFSLGFLLVIGILGFAIWMEMKNQRKLEALILSLRGR